MAVIDDINKLPSQFRNTDGGNNANLHKLLSAMLQPFYDVQANLSEMNDKLLIMDSATGSQLDTIGIMVNELRESFGDADFRTNIKLKSKLNNADGTLDFVMFAVENAINAEQSFCMEKNAEIVIYLQLTELLNDRQIQIMRDLVAAGIKITVYYTLNTTIYPIKLGYATISMNNGNNVLGIGEEQEILNLDGIAVGENSILALGSTPYTEVLTPLLIGDDTQYLAIGDGTQALGVYNRVYDSTNYEYLAIHNNKYVASPLLIHQLVVGGDVGEIVDFGMAFPLGDGSQYLAISMPTYTEVLTPLLIGDDTQYLAIGDGTQALGVYNRVHDLAPLIIRTFNRAL